MTARRSARRPREHFAPEQPKCAPGDRDERAECIILIRHGQPDIPVAPRASHGEFRSYIDAYEQSGLDPQSAPPEELQDLVGELAAVFTSGKRRADDSARVLAPNAELIADPLFVEAPL